MKKILSFKQFSENPSDIFEADGFGTSPFLLKKISDNYNYFFNIETEKGDDVGYRLIVGKYSENQVIEGAKNSYCVLSINQIPHELIEDIAIDKEEIPEINDSKFKAEGSEVSRLMEFVSKCLTNYLEFNPKVNRIYDELQKNLEFSGEGTYLEFMKSIILSYLGKNWYVQEGTDKETILISR